MHARSFAGFAALVALAGCGTSPEIPEAERVDAPALAFSQGAPNEKPELATHRIAARTSAERDDAAEIVLAALGEETWPKGVAIDRTGGDLRMFAPKRFHDAVERVLAALARGRGQRLKLEVRAREVPRATACSLGPLEPARGHGPESPFLRVPLSTDALARIEALADEGEAREIATASVSAPVGRFATLSEGEQRAFVGGGYGDFDRGVVAPTIGTFETTLDVRASGVALDDATIVLAFRVSDSVPVESGTLVCRARGGDFDVELAGWVRRLADDAVFLRAGESIALVGTAERAGFVRLIILTPRIDRDGGRA